ncbi:MAG: alpha/beta fold hydrolase [Acidimicrobiales bacterium]
MPKAQANGIDLHYDERGEPDGVPLLLISGLGSQSTSWDPDLLDAFADRGFRVVTFDNRDVWLSTWIDAPGLRVLKAIASAAAGVPVEAPYVLADMAADAVGLLDALGIEAAHVVGVSMGGMIAQTMAIEHPGRVLSLTSVMSTTGARDVGGPTGVAGSMAMRPSGRSRDEAIAVAVERARAIGTPDAFDEERVTAKAAAAYDRAFNPAGAARQVLAILASGSRAERLRELAVPTLVIHGALDPLVDISGGRRTAELVPGATLVEIDDMAHDLPPNARARVVDAITRHVAASLV